MSAGNNIALDEGTRFAISNPKPSPLHHPALTRTHARSPGFRGEGVMAACGFVGPHSAANLPFEVLILRHDQAMYNKSSLLMLIALIAVTAVLLLFVLWPFLVPLFVAAVMAVLFRPMHLWLSEKLFDRQRIAAAITTVAVSLLVVLPIGAVLVMAGGQIVEFAKDSLAWLDQHGDSHVQKTIEKIEETRDGRRLNSLYQELPVAQQEQFREAVARLSQGVASEVYAKTRGFLSDVFSFTVGLGAMALALYYFLADAPVFLRQLHRLLLLDRAEEVRLTQKFQSVCRGVVLGTVVSGLIQAVLVGIGLAVLQVSHLWLLTVLAMLCSFLPVVGTAAVWGPVAALLLLNGEFASGIGLVLYGSLIVATSDNLIRAYVIGNRARLHPLIALVTVFGAINLIGLWGVFVGPMAAALFYALTDILRDRLRPDDGESAGKSSDPAGTAVA